MKHRSRLSFTFLSLLVFIIAVSIGTLADDKHKNDSKPTAPAKSGGSNQPHANSGSGGGGNSGRPSNGNAGRPNGNSSNGRPGNSTGSGSNGRPGGSTSANNGRPGNTGSSNGRPGSPSNNGRPGANGNNGTPGRPGANNASNGNRGPNNSNGGRGPSNATNGHGNNSPGNGRGTSANNSKGSSVNRHEPVRNVHEEHGHSVARDERGRVREIHNVRDSRGREMSIHRDFRGGSRFETRRAGGGRIVGYGRGRGFAERRYYARGGRVYYQRTYVYGGRSYAVAYRYYPYHGVYYYGYAPAYYYHPGFYGWAYNPWAVPVTYAWGWGAAPWYGYYGYYFTPYPVYATASLWLTDYLISENLRASYEAQVQANADAAAAAQNAPPQSNGQAALTPEVKQMIADEVKRQLDEERAAAAQPQPAQQASASQSSTPAEEMPAALDPNQRIFIVASNLDLAGDSGECTVTSGDVLMRMGTSPDADNKIAVNVVSSKQGDCPANTNSNVEVTDLQEMHNQFREKLDTGLKTLADNSGKNGLPKAPDTSTTGGEVPPPAPDSDAASELQDQQKSAEQAERDVQQPASGSGGGHQ